jgi:hypothetical protein
MEYLTLLNLAPLRGSLVNLGMIPLFSVAVWFFNYTRYGTCRGVLVAERARHRMHARSRLGQAKCRPPCFRVAERYPHRSCLLIEPQDT